MSESVQIWVDRFQWPAVAIVAGLVVFGISQDGSFQIAEDPAGTVIVASDRPAELIRGREYFHSGDYATAVSCYNKVLDARPAASEALLNRAAAHARLGDFDAAVSDAAACREAAQSLEAVQASTLRLAEIHMLAQRTHQAGVALDAYLLHNTTNPHAWGLRAAQRMTEGNWRAAVRDHSHVIRLDRASADAFANRGLCYVQLNEFRKARTDFSRALALAVDHPAAIVNSCLVHLRFREFPAVIERTTSAIDAGHAPAIMHVLRARAMTQLGRDDAAEIDFAIAESVNASPGDEMQPLVQKDDQASDVPAWQFSRRSYYVPQLAFHAEHAEHAQPGDVDADHQAAVSESQLAELSAEALRLNAEGDADTAIAFLSELLHLSGTNDHARFLKTVMAIDSGDLEAALTDVNILLRARPDYATALCLRGLIYARRGKHDAAIRDFSDVIRLQPDGHEGYSNRAVVYMSQGKWSLAVADFQRAAERGAEASSNNSQLGRALAKCGRFEEALDCHDAAVVASGRNPLALRDRALTCMESQRLEEAVADLTAAIRIAPRQPELLRLRARAHVLNQDYEAALNDVARAKEMAPAAVPLDQLRQHLANLVAHQSADSNDM